MTEEKMDSEQVKRLRKRRNYVEFVGLCVGLIGGMFLVFSVMEAGAYNDLEYKNKYLTNPDLPISEWGNATWKISFSFKSTSPFSNILHITGFNIISLRRA